MITVGSILPDVGRVYGNSNRETCLNRLNSAVDLLSAKGTWNPLLGFMDICSDEGVLALPSDVEMPLAVNIGGHPAEFRNKWFEYHINGPGSDCCRSACSFRWEDLMKSPTYRRVTRPSQLAFVSSDASDIGLTITVYGNGPTGLKLVHTDPATGVTVDGHQYEIGAANIFDDVLVKDIYRVSKPITKGFITGTMLPNGSANETVICIYDPNLTEPMFRRISVSSGGCGTSGCGCESFTSSGCTNWVRMRFRRTTQELIYDADPIFLHSKQAILLAVMAVKKFDGDLLADGANYLTQAEVFLQDKQRIENGPNTILPQFQARGWGGAPGLNLI